MTDEANESVPPVPLAHAEHFASASPPSSLPTYVGTMHDVQRHHHRPANYYSPSSLAETFALLTAHGSTARLIAGGTDLVLQIARGAITGIDALIDLANVPGLRDLSADQVVRIGALVTHNDLLAARDLHPLLSPLVQACAELGAPALRNRATIVGNIVTASPANDTISALWALDATVVIRSATGERHVPIREFFPGMRRTVLQPGELVVRLEVPVLGPDRRGVFVKAGQRRAQAISIVHLAVVVGFDGITVRSASIALGSVAPTIVSAVAAETALIGTELTDADIARAARLAVEQVRPISDIRASADYRRSVLHTGLTRALTALRDQTLRPRPAAVLLRSTQTGDIPATKVAIGRSLGSAGVHLGDAGHPTDNPATSNPPTVPDPQGAAVAAALTDATVVTCRLNGQPASADGAVTTLLLDWLRDSHGLTGTKEGCAEGECGACTVHLDGEAMLSCLIPAASVAGRHVTTIEGLAAAGSPLPQAFVDQFAVQCGYCIPGFVMSADRLLAGDREPSRATIAEGLSGNLCRCTGYYRFYDAVEQAARTGSHPETAVSDLASTPSEASQ